MSRSRAGRDRRELEVLHRAAVALSGSLSFGEVLNVLARELVLAVDRATECSISLWDPAANELVGAAAYNRFGPPSWAEGGNDETLNSYPATLELLETGEGFREHRLTDPDILREDREALELWGWRASLELPLVVDGRSVGLIEVADHRSAHRFAQRDVAFCQTIASLAAVAVRNARVYDDLRRRAEQDSLTGLLTHGAFYQRLERELERARLPREPVAVLVFDLDEFKSLNDSLGHVAGDEALRRAAQALRSVCRTDDVLGRLGGDEFGAVLPGTGTQTELVAHRLLRSLASAGLSASAGVAVSHPSETNAVALVSRAEVLLREAKRSGKRRLRLSGLPAS
jgi:diguanylate cyclase (GGDEF)-like protein